jgi:hypothetical protein
VISQHNPLNGSMRALHAERTSHSALAGAAGFLRGSLQPGFRGVFINLAETSGTMESVHGSMTPHIPENFVDLTFQRILTNLGLRWIWDGSAVKPRHSLGIVL